MISFWHYVKRMFLCMNPAVLVCGQDSLYDFILALCEAGLLCVRHRCVVDGTICCGCILCEHR